jgi:DNA-binding CsgD family transcriptional regulator
MLSSAEVSGVPVAQVVKDLPTLPRLGEVKSVPWEEVATFFNRTDDFLSKEEQIQIGERYVENNPLFAMGAQALGSCRRMHELGLKLAPFSFPFLGVEDSRLPDGRNHTRAVLPGELTGSPAYFRGFLGQTRALPRLLNLPDAECEWEISSHEASYKIRWPEAPRRDISERVLKIATEGITQLMAHFLGFENSSTSSGREEFPRARLAQERFGLTPSEARVACALSDGKSTAEIAAELGVKPDTVRTHLKKIYGKTGTARQAQLVCLMSELRLT